MGHGRAARLAVLVLLVAGVALVTSCCSASLTIGDRDTLTSHLEVISTGWVQASVDAADTILAQSWYTASDWEEYFSYYFANHLLNYNLAYFLEHPVFFWFGEEVNADLQAGLYPVLTARIAELTAAHPSDLGAAMDTDSDLRDTLVSAHRFLVFYASRGIVVPQQNLYDFCADYITEYPQYFSHATTLGVAAQPYIGYLRTQVCYNLREAVRPLPVADIASCLDLAGPSLALWQNHLVLIEDNGYFNTEQFAAIDRFLSAVPAPLSMPGMITVNDRLGNTGDRWLGHWTTETGVVNIWNFRIGQVVGSEFPSDVAMRTMDGFLSTLVHEANHVVAYWDIYEGDPVLAARQNSLLAAAGTDHMNYLRSMFDDGFFAGAPQEFFASMSQQWFADSLHTIELGIVRFNAGRPDPINQALFLAEVHSCGGDSTVFYTGDEEANLTSQRVPLTRDANGHINSLRVGEQVYWFDLDAEGDVTAIHQDASLMLTHAPADQEPRFCRTNPITITFRQPVVQSSAEARFALKLGDKLVPGTIDWPIAQRKLRFRPAKPLAARALHNVILASGIQWAAGGTCGWSESFSFRASNQPVVTACSPQGTDVPLSRKVRFFFD